LGSSCASTNPSWSRLRKWVAFAAPFFGVVVDGSVFLSSSSSSGCIRRKWRRTRTTQTCIEEERCELAGIKIREGAELPESGTTAVGTSSRGVAAGERGGG